MVVISVSRPLLSTVRSGVRIELVGFTAKRTTISSGQLSLVAALLGYKTGFCSAYNLSQLQAITKDEPKLMVGVGYENIDKDRRLHGTLFNKDIPKQYRTGEDDERWRFPSFDKKIKIEINNERRN